MSFLNPLFLLGMLGISVPITIHLLTRMRPRPVKWAAMELLRKTIHVKSRRIRLEDLLLLILRCLAILLLTLAMAQPIITGSNAGLFGIGRKRTGVVIAVDGSFSMEHKPTVSSRFDLALNQIDEIRKTLELGDVVSLVLMGNRPRIHLRNAMYESLKFKDAVQDLKPLQESLNLERSLEEIRSLISEMKTPVRECYIITDAQKISWANVSEYARKSLQDITSQAGFFILTTGLLGIGDDETDNLSLTELQFVSGSLRKNSWGRYVAKIWNVGSQPQENVEVSLLCDGKPVDKRTVSRIEPDETKSMPLFVQFSKSGNIKLTAKLNWDALLTDNSRYLVSHVRDNVRILCVNGTLSNQPYQSETDYLKTALVPKNVGASFSLSIETLHWTNLWTKQLSNYDVVILANLPEIRSDQAERLYNFLQMGKGLIIFLGDKVDLQLFNSGLQLDQISLIPAELLRVVRSENVGQTVSDLAIRNERSVDEGWSVEIADPNHPLSNALKGLPTELLDQARLYQFFEAKSHPSSQEILKVATKDMPLLIEKKVGGGKVLMFTSSADRDWTNLPIHPAYPILIHEMVSYLTMKAYDRPIQVGESMVVPLPFDAKNSLHAEVTLCAPTGEEIFLQTSEQEGRKVVKHDVLGSSGFYELYAGIGSEPILLAVNVDPSESDVETLNEKELKKSLLGVQVQILREDDDLLTEIRKSRVGRELWSIFMILTLVALILESYLAHRFPKRFSYFKT